MWNQKKKILRNAAEIEICKDEMADPYGMQKGLPLRRRMRYVFVCSLS